MKNFILPILITCALNVTALAVDVSPAQVEDPKKADEVLITNSQTKKLSVEERRKELKKKHAAKKAAAAAAAAAKAASKIVSVDNSEANLDPLKDMQNEKTVQEHKEDKAPNK